MNKRWPNMPPNADNTTEHSKYRYALEAKTAYGLEWIGSYSSANKAWNRRVGLRLDWKYQVYDCYAHKVVERFV